MNSENEAILERIVWVLLQNLRLSDTMAREILAAAKNTFNNVHSTFYAADSTLYAADSPSPAIENGVGRALTMIAQNITRTKARTTGQEIAQIASTMTQADQAIVLKIARTIEQEIEREPEQATELEMAQEIVRRLQESARQ